MSEWNVVPAIRVGEMASGLESYRDRLGFTVERGGPEEANCALSFGGARIMVDSVPTDHYSPGYNEAIQARMGRSSPMALYIEAADLEGLYERVQSEGVPVVDSIADRPWGQREFTVEDPQGNWLSFWHVLEAEPA